MTRLRGVCYLPSLHLCSSFLLFQPLCATTHAKQSTTRMARNNGDRNLPTIKVQRRGAEAFSSHTAVARLVHRTPSKQDSWTRA